MNPLVKRRDRLEPIWLLAESKFVLNVSRIHLRKLIKVIARLHAHIIGHYNPSLRIIDLVSYTTYAVCVNFIHKWRDLQFKVDSV